MRLRLRWRGLRRLAEPGRAAAAVQDAIEKRLAAVLDGPVRIHGSGRTDAGVHARGQVFHFDAVWRHGPEKLVAALRTGLPADNPNPIAPPGAARIFTRGFRPLGKSTPTISSWATRTRSPGPTHGRSFGRSTWRRWRRRRRSLRGRHDFKAFSASREGGGEDTVRDLRRLDLARRGRRIRITAEGDGFLYKMVRSLAARWWPSGEGRLTPAQAREILASRRRTPSSKRLRRRGSSCSGWPTLKPRWGESGPIGGAGVPAPPEIAARRFGGCSRAAWETRSFLRSASTAADWWRTAIIGICAPCARRRIDFVRPPACGTCGHPFFWRLGGGPDLPALRRAGCGLRPRTHGRPLSGPARSLVIELKYHGGAARLAGHRADSSAFAGSRGPGARGGAGPGAAASAKTARAGIQPKRPIGERLWPGPAGAGARSRRLCDGWRTRRPRRPSTGAPGRTI